MHGTNKAFERYVRGEAKPQRAITEKLNEMRAGKVVRIPDVSRTACK